MTLLRRRAPRWNHNTHYNRLVLRSAPTDARTALDVGCGEGDLLAALVPVIPDVTGIDADATVLGLAAAVAPGGTLICADFLAHPLPSDAFDLVAAVASLHHMDATAALARIRDIVRPGGVAVVIGLARPHHPVDHLMEAIGVVASWAMRVFVGYKDVRAPVVWPPPLTYAECRRLGQQLVEGAAFKRRLVFRYSLIWTKPPQ